MAALDNIQILRNLAPRHPVLVGLDSDGCVFDSMSAKQTRCFTPNTIRFFGLEAVADAAAETAHFVNLHSRWRGQNRFPALLKTLELLTHRPEVRAAGVAIPDLAPLRRWVAVEPALGNASLEAQVRRTADPLLTRVLEWSRTINEWIGRLVRESPLFPGVAACLRTLAERADVVVVSQTPLEALRREWQASGLGATVRHICGQEYGTKAEQLRLAFDGRYTPDRVLMVGDAAGDLHAAREAGVRFFPIRPGQEAAAWEELAGDGLPRFLEGRFDDAYRRALVERFEGLLPEAPPWEKSEE
jgi:phosphoglycolate phosphatase-like HAD superfamily hydrolase